MQVFGKNLSALSFISVAVLLSACNLSVITPETGMPTILPSETPNVSMDTVMPVPSLTSTVTFVPLPSPTFTTTSSFVTLSAAFTPSTLTLFPTATTFFTPTATPTQQWSVCPGIVVTKTDTNEGDTLHILRCEDGLEYDLGPLAHGTYAVGPNDKFLVYVTINGMIYASKIGDRHLVTVFNLTTERIFTSLNKKLNGDFKISFTGNELNYKLVILERKYDQKRVYDLPVTITR
jgi:hypothetical protein